MVTDGEILTEQCYTSGDNGDSVSGDSKNESESEQTETIDKENKKSEFRPILEEWTWGEVIIACNIIQYVNMTIGANTEIID